MADDVIISGIYQHYKGQQYRVYGLARHSETLEILVYYECLYPNELGQMWVRPLELFTGDVLINGQRQKRFTLVSAS